MKPTELLPPVTPFTSHLTIGFPEPVTLAENCCCAFTWTVTLAGVTLTETPDCTACPESGLTIKTVASTASKFDPVMLVSKCRSELSQAGSGAPEMNHAAPLSARIMPYCLSAVKIIWLVAEKPEISKLALEARAHGWILRSGKR